MIISIFSNEFTNHSCDLALNVTIQAFISNLQLTSQTCFSIQSYSIQLHFSKQGTLILITRNITVFERTQTSSINFSYHSKIVQYFFSKIQSFKIPFIPAISPCVNTLLNTTTLLTINILKTWLHPARLTFRLHLCFSLLTKDIAYLCCPVWHITVSLTSTLITKH